MSLVHLRQVDLNLLVVLHELLGQGSVSRAARRLGRTQSAVSHSLGRLRSLFGDELFVREGNRMVPTDRASHLVEPLQGILGQIDRVLRAPEEFSSGCLERRFVVAATDYAEVVVLPGLLRRIREDAPGVEIAAVAVRDDLHRDLLRGSRDLGLGGGFQEQAGLTVETLFEERFVCLVSTQHPRIGDRLTLHRFLAEDHILIMPEGKAGDRVDEALGAQGMTRRVVLQVQHHAAATLVASRTDLVLTLPKRLATKVRDLAPTRLLELPLEVPTLDLQILYPNVRCHDPAHAWLRGVLRDVCDQTT